MRITACLLCVLLLLSGCSQSVSIEMSNRLIIEAIGIDTSEDGYKVSVLALNTLQTGSANSTETPDGITKVFEATGKSIADAFANIDLVSSQVPLYSQARVLVLGKELAENQPINALNFFIREYTTRDDILVAVSETTASQIISANLGKNLLTSKAIKNLLQSGDRNALTVAVPLYELIGNLLSKTQGAYLPILKTEKKDKNEDEIKGAGLALFSDKNYTATLDKDKIQGFLWAMNRIDNALLVVENNKANISLAIQKAKTKIKKDKNDPYSFILEVSFSCEIIEQNSIVQELTQQDLTQISMLAEEKVKKEIEDFLQFSMVENSCDCLKLTDRILRKNPKMSAEISENYAAFLKTIKTDIKADARILRSGREVLQKD